jgi:hypothetical protein
MDEINPYQSPENSGAAPSASPRPSFTFRLVGGVFVGVSIAGLFIALALVLDPPMFLSDLIEDGIKALAVGILIGFIVGATWGVLSATRFFQNKRPQ